MAVSLSVGCSNGRAYVPASVSVSCEVDRQECAAEAFDLNTGALTCAAFEEAHFFATACRQPSDSASSACGARYCTPDSMSPYGFGSPPCKILNASDVSSQSGICVPDAASLHQASVAYEQRSRLCVPSPSTTSCDQLQVLPVNKQVCLDVSEDSAVNLLAPPTANRDRSVEIIQFTANDPSCPLAGSNGGTTTYALAGTSLGTFSASGMNSTAIPLTSGTVTMSGNTLTSMVANVSNLTVQEISWVRLFSAT